MSEQLLPAWFVPRMMDDVWSFGLLLTNGSILCITSIIGVHKDATGNIWLDVDMMEERPFCAGHSTGPFMIAPTSRTTASVNATHIVAAFELADT